MLLNSGGGKLQTCAGLTLMLFPRRRGAGAQGDLTQSNPGLQSAPSLDTVHLPLGGCCLCRGRVPTRRACPERPRARGLCEGGAALDTGARARPTWTTAQWCSQLGSYVACQQSGRRDSGHLLLNIAHLGYSKNLLASCLSPGRPPHRCWPDFSAAVCGLQGPAPQPGAKALHGLTPTPLSCLLSQYQLHLPSLKRLSSPTSCPLLTMTANVYIALCVRGSSKLYRHALSAHGSLRPPFYEEETKAQTSYRTYSRSRGLGGRAQGSLPQPQAV